MTRVIWVRFGHVSAQITRDSRRELGTSNMNWANVNWVKVNVNLGKANQQLVCQCQQNTSESLRTTWRPAAAIAERHEALAGKPLLPLFLALLFPPAVQRVLEEFEIGGDCVSTLI